MFPNLSNLESIPEAHLLHFAPSSVFDRLDNDISQCVWYGSPSSVMCLVSPRGWPWPHKPSRSTVRCTWYPPTTWARGYDGTRCANVTKTICLEEQDKEDSPLEFSPTSISCTPPSKVWHDPRRTRRYIGRLSTARDPSPNMNTIINTYDVDAKILCHEYARP